MDRDAGSPALVIGGSSAARADALAERLRSVPRDQIRHEQPARWPFARHVGAALPPSGALTIVAVNLDRAFPAGQTGTTRFVLTQSSYQLQRWLDWIDRRGTATMIASADTKALRHTAPEAFQKRGPWSRFEVTDLGVQHEPEPEPEPEPEREREPELELELEAELRAAFTTSDAEERLARCRRAADARGADPVAQLALGSAYMEVQDWDASAAAIDRAIAIDGGWEASHYERGKLHLRLDDLESARRSFAEAARLMPSFSSALSNLGATCGELDRPEDALRAFEQALTYDPAGYQVLNNIGVVSRELGRLSHSEAALRKVTTIAPEFVFGHYNLGHTLFLQGRYQAALSAYAEGQRRDPEKNARQACRLAVVRLATGDADGSLRDLQRFTTPLPADQKREILVEVQEILWALLTDRPDLAGWRQVADAVKSQLNALH